MEEKRRKILKNICKALIAAATPAFFFYLLECYTHNPFAEVRPYAQVFNIVLFDFFAGILFLLTGKMRTSLRIEAVIAMIFGIANAYVVRFRTNPIVPWDIFSWRTAASVAGNYDFTPDVRMLVVSAVFLFSIFALRFLHLECRCFKLSVRIASAAAVCVMLAFFCGTLQKESFQNRYRLYNKLFTPVYMTDVDGIAVTFVMNLAYMSIDKPSGYNQTEAAALLSSYESTASAGNGKETIKGETASDGELPNIIVVMNESFSDLSVLGDFTVNEDYMPYLHSLQEGAENTVTGMLNVSVCGGNTANTEFEFLTGNTMAFLPQGSIPYQQYITGELPALPSYLEGLGYQTVAAHPYYSTGWERNTVYPWLGFEHSLFLNDFYGAKYVRQYVSDESCVDRIIRLYEEKEEGSPLFVFNVTMQNHGGYADIYDNFTPDIEVTGANNVSLNQYLSLVKLSDASLEQLITYFSGVDEKTVVVFFGDHQPSDTVAYSILAQNGMKWNELSEEETKLRYQVPYVIWANYDIEEETGADTSANYLAAEVLSRAGVPTSAYQSWLLELKEEYPIISTVRTVDATGEETRASDEKGSMDTYRRLQYYQLFDWEEDEKE